MARLVHVVGTGEGCTGSPGTAAAPVITTKYCWCVVLDSKEPMVAIDAIVKKAWP